MEATDHPNVGRALRRGSLLLIGLTLSLQLYAVWSRPHLPLVDLPNHAARHYLEAQALAGQESPFYEVRWRLVPNLGGDLFIPLLMQLFSPETAIALAVTLAVLGFWLGAAWFLSEQGGTQDGTLLACLLLLPWVFNGQLFWGFFNFYSGLGLAFAILAHFSRLLKRERPGVVPLVLHGGLVALLFLWHLAAWGDYGLIMGCLLLGRCIAWYRAKAGLGACLRRAGVLLLPILPSLVLCALYVAGNRDLRGSGHLAWGTWERKLVTALSAFRGYDRWTDAVAVALWLGAIVAGFVLDRREQRNLGMFLSVVALSLLYLLLPYQLGSTSDTDSRLLPALLVCALGWLGGWPVRRVPLVLALLGLCIALRYSSVIVAWERLRDRLDEASASFESLERGSRVLPLIMIPEPSKEWPESHFLCWSVVGQGTFVPTLFSARDQQPLDIRQEYRNSVVAPARLIGPEAALPSEALLRAEYDAIWIFHPTGQPPRLPAGFECVREGERFTVWRIRPGERGP